MCTNIMNKCVNRLDKATVDARDKRPYFFYDVIYRAARIRYLDHRDFTEGYLYRDNDVRLIWEYITPICTDWL